MATEKARALEAEIEKHGGWQSVIDAIADGATIRSLAAKFKVSRSFLHLVMTHGPAGTARKPLIAKAYLERAHSRMDESMEIMDGAPLTNEAIKKAEAQVKLRQWLAGVDNSVYRRQTEGAAISLNIGQLHLTALRAPITEPALPIMEAEVLAIEASPDQETHNENG